ncbi:MAG: hypothetical protein Q4E12_01955 [Coriobacteriia bacterium]|nr:hypothetical protein [Coriobacteriia bacterium]
METNNQPNQQPNDNMRQVQSVTNMYRAGAICAGISLLFGGVFLAAAGFICVFIGMSRSKAAFERLNASSSETKRLLKALNASRNIALVVCVIAMALNVYALVVLWPVMMEVMNSGSLDALYQMFGISGDPTAAGGTGNIGDAGNTSSVWG